MKKWGLPILTFIIGVIFSWYFVSGNSLHIMPKSQLVKGDLKAPALNNQFKNDRNLKDQQFLRQLKDQTQDPWSSQASRPQVQDKQDDDQQDTYAWPHFFGGNDPFEHMKMMQERIKQFFKDDDFFGSDSFLDDHDFFKGLDLNQLNSSRGDAFGPQVTQKESNGLVKVIIDLKGVDRNNFRVDIKENMIQMSGTIRQESTQKGKYGASKSIHISSFSRSIPVPKGVDAASVEMSNSDNDQLILSFPKL